MFKRAGSSSRTGSRANSSERILESSQRPVSIASTGSSSTLPTNFTLQQVQAPTTPAKVKEKYVQDFTNIYNIFYPFRQNHQHQIHRSEFDHHQHRHPVSDRKTSQIKFSFLLQVLHFLLKNIFSFFFHNCTINLVKLIRKII